VIGDSVNLAARLMAAAGRGHILVSAATAERTGDEFELQQLEPISVKGKSQPIEISRVEGIRKKHLTIIGEAGQMQFVGRLVEMRKLSLLAQRAAHEGGGAWVYIHGEPGIGKTRLCAELAATLRSDGWRILIGVCPAYNSRIAYSAWVEPLRILFEIEISDTPAQGWKKLLAGVEKLCPQLLTFTPLVAEVLSIPFEDNPVVRSLDAKTRRDRRMSTITSLIGAIAKQQPVFLLFDDVHWIDASSAELIAQVTSQTDFRVFSCLTSRYETLPEGLAPAQPDHSLELKKLSDQASRDLLQQMTELSSENVEAIVDRARGNPLFIKELSRSGASGKGELPESIYDVIMVRLDQLRNGSKSTLQFASVIGSTFETRLLKNLMDNARRPASEAG
jgi:predicted ATPase